MPSFTPRKRHFLAMSTAAVCCAATAISTGPAAAATYRAAQNGNATLYAYVMNPIGRTVTIVDINTRSVAATLNIGGEPLAVVTSPSGRFAYALNGDVEMIDASTLKVIRTFTKVGSEPESIAISPNGQDLYVTSDGGTVDEVNAYSGKPVASTTTNTFPTPIILSPDGQYVYVGDYGSGTVQIFNAALTTQIAEIHGLDGPTGLALTPDGKSLYVANSLTEHVTVIDTTTDSIIATVPTHYRPTSVAMSPDGTTVFVANKSQNPDSLESIRVSTNHVIGEYPVGMYSDGVALTPSGDVGVDTEYYNANLVIFNTHGKRVIATVPVGTGATAVAIGRFADQ